MLVEKPKPMIKRYGQNSWECVLNNKRGLGETPALAYEGFEAVRYSDSFDHCIVSISTYVKNEY